MDQVFHIKLVRLLGAKSVLADEALSRHTTFRIGGPADFFVTPKDIEDLRQVILLCDEYNKPFMLIGNGSNLLVSDEGYRGVMIKYSPKTPIFYKELELVNEQVITADSDILLPKFALEVSNRGLTGLEFATGIPGSLGGAIAMNAGAYGGEIKDFISSALVMDKNGTVVRLSKEELKLTYRHSIIQECGYIVLQAEFILKKSDLKTILAQIEEVNQLRKEKQPLEYPSAGSAFKRPKGYYAGKLIQDAGLCGYRLGGASISEKHCGFVVNTGGATAKDVYQLLNDVIRIVNDKFGVLLEPEIKLIGDF